MTEVKKSLPLWILIVSGLFALMEIGVSGMICFSPQEVLEKVDIRAKGVDFLIYMWASRQFALGFIFAFATFKKSVPMLILAYIFFVVMFVGDLAIGIVQKENSLIFSAIAMCGIGSVMILVLSKKK